MKILNYGSLNLDFVYSVPHFVKACETLASTSRQVFPGGKGLNQSVALARAGACVYHAGAVGGDSGQLVELLKQSGADISFVRTRSDVATGHAVIQVDPNGQNCILLYGSANQSQRKDEIDEVLSFFDAGDLLLLQNEINEIETLIHSAKARQMTVALNPSPITPALINDMNPRAETLDPCLRQDREELTRTGLKTPLELVDIFILNEIEARFICNEEDGDKQLSALRKLYPKAEIVLTLGKKGVLCLTAADEKYAHGIYDVPVADTTAAGDTFIGFYLASLTGGKSVAEALKTASAASAIAVSRPGAAVSIPTMQETKRFLEEHSNSINKRG